MPPVFWVVPWGMLTENSVNTTCTYGEKTFASVTVTFMPFAVTWSVSLRPNP